MSNSRITRGRNNITAFPAMQAIPAPELPLQGVAYDKYVELAKGLLNAKKLTTFTRMQCEQFAIMHAKAAQVISRNGLVSAGLMDAMSKLMKELQLVDQSDAVASPIQGQKNRFSRIGVIVRPGTQKAEVQPS